MEIAVINSQFLTRFTSRMPSFATNLRSTHIEPAMLPSGQWHASGEALSYARLTTEPKTDCLTKPAGNVVFGQLVFGIGKDILGVINFYQLSKMKIGRAL